MPSAKHGQLSIRDMLISTTGICLGLVLLQTAVSGSETTDTLVFLAGLFLSGGSVFAIIGRLYWGQKGAVAGLFLGGLALSLSFVWLQLLMSAWSRVL